jgi:saccharopine dehydrogenase-like NADP-dependent oxidoreductase
MKVIVIGGYGMFGSRLCRLLARDGHQVWVAGRSLTKARSMASKLGAKPLRLNRDGDWPDLSNAEVLIDAAGPFQTYTDDPYRTAQRALEAGMHYLDLCDDAAFCVGITEMDDLAKQRGKFALSGVSSVPALSSAVVAQLAQGAPIDAIDRAILPGNRAPRGWSVMASIMGQAGRPFPTTIDGQPTPTRSWSNPGTFAISDSISRLAYMIEVPDQRLFP